MLQTPIAEEALSEWRARAANEKVLQRSRHAKVETSLLLDPYVLRGLDDLHVKTALLSPFYLKGNGAQVRVGPPAALREWGVPEGSFTRRNAEVARGVMENDWSTMYRPVAERCLAARRGRKANSTDSLELLRSPSMTKDGPLSTREPRTGWLLKKKKVPHVMVPKSPGRKQVSWLHGLDARQLRLVLSLYALADLDVWGGIDPNHVCVLDGAFSMSEECAYRLGMDPEGLMSELVGPLAGFFSFIPAVIARTSVFPSSREHILYRGISNEPECRSFSVRPIRWAMRKGSTE